MASENLVILIGKLGQEPQFFNTEYGPGVSLSIATPKSWKDKDSGERRERTLWHKVVAYRGLVQIVREHISGKTGKELYIKGELHPRTYKDDQGHDQYVSEVVAEVIQLTGNRAEAAPHTAPASAKGNKAGNS